MAQATPSHASDRFLDADKEPNKMLLPIEGYENYPLVSLEEAVEPLKSLLHDLDVMVMISKRNSRKPKDGLTIDESAAIHLYTLQWDESQDSLYFLLNRTLRSARRNDLKPWFSYLKLFLTALHKLPSIKSTIWRGVRGDASKDYDEDVIWWGLSSCTETMKVMEDFIGTSDVRTLFLIESTDGKAIINHSHFEEENEIVLMPGTYFRIVDKWSPAQDLYIVHLRQSTPPWKIVASPIQSSLLNDEKISIQNLDISKDKDSSDAQTESTKKVVHRLPNISTNAKWTQYGVTVAGGHGPGDSLNQLSTPSNIYIDENRTMYITDNNRVLEWKCDATSGEVMAGGNGKGNRADQLNGPSDLFVDKSTDSMIICDWGNKRVMRWPYRNGTSGETILSNFMCSRLTMDDQGALYVSDYGKGEVRRYRTGDVYGEVVAGGNGHGNNLNQLHWPASVFVDRDRAVYVSEINNHRVVKWNENAQVGTVVAAGCGPGNNLTQLHSPRGIIVDQLGSLYVADCLNHRIMRWCKGKTEGDVIVGGNGQGNRADQLSIPAALSFDQDGNLYVVDTENHRVQRFNIV
ncbi:unnamed protein product [Adineta steineri]|uniref:NAD(P)(+)--arginine ADP-ribosyltransferase n=1 Tax=Adineta steineri TaxID=433720 RepID=A0A819MJI4_9BILA|nr:unnamed protein product [Adineta steineri]